MKKNHRRSFLAVCFGLLCVTTIAVSTAKMRTERIAAAPIPDLVISTNAEFATFIDDINAQSTHDNTKCWEGKLIELAADVSYTITSKPLNGSFFCGTFDGKGHTITLNANLTSTCTNLFRNIGDNGVFKNTNFAGSITGSNYSAVLCTYNNGKIEDCTSAVSVTATGDYAAGFVYENVANKGKVLNCANNGIVKAKIPAGICNDNKAGALIDGCVNNGTTTVTASTNGAAGIATKNYGTITNCTHNGTIGVDPAGLSVYSSGIAHLNSGANAVISNSKSSALATYPTNIGYMAGISYYSENGASISKCTNYSTLSVVGIAKGNVGGIAGYSRNGASIDNCKNHGNITVNKEFGGGIVAINGDGISNTGTTITNCANFGIIKSTYATGSGSVRGDIGGIGGFSYDGSQYIHCSNYGKIVLDSANAYGAGGINGHSDHGVTKIINCANTGTIEHTGDTAAYIGGAVGLHKQATATITYDGQTEIQGFLSAGDLISAYTGSAAVYIGSLAGVRSYDVINPLNNYSIALCTPKEDVGTTGLHTRLAVSASADVKNFIMYVREFECTSYSYRTELAALRASLSADDLALLNQLTYYGRYAGVTGTYVDAADYILAYTSGGGGGAGLQRSLFSNQANIFMMLGFAALAALGFVFVSRRKRTI